MTSSDYIGRISKSYGLYVLDSRAIPSISDGLKTSQRIALWLMRNKSEKIKTISLVGEMIASGLYVHGDAAAGDTISLIAAPYCNNIPLLDSVGSFGTLADPTSFGAPRYTYVKRSKFAQKALYADIDIVPMIENYDGSSHMPLTFLPLIPIVLLNGIRGIAPGWSTNILPRKFEDLVSAVQEVLTDGNVKTKLMPYYHGRDIRIESRGDNQYTIYGKLTKKNTSTVLVYSLPPDLTLERFKEYLIRLEEEGKISDWTDRSSEAINIEIKMRRSDLQKMDEDRLIEFFKLRTLVTENITVQGIGGRRVVNYESAEDLVKDWVIWRLGLYLNRYERLLEDERVTNLYWQLVVSCFKHDLASDTKELSDKASVKNRIMEIGRQENIPTPTDEIVERIAIVPLYKWAKDGLEEAEKQLRNSSKRISEYDDMVRSKTKRKNVFSKEVESLRSELPHP